MVSVTLPYTLDGTCVGRQDRCVFTPLPFRNEAQVTWKSPRLNPVFTYLTVKPCLPLITRTHSSTQLRGNAGGLATALVTMYTLWHIRIDEYAFSYILFHNHSSRGSKLNSA